MVKYCIVNFFAPVPSEFEIRHATGCTDGLAINNSTLYYIAQCLLSNIYSLNLIFPIHSQPLLM